MILGSTAAISASAQTQTLRPERSITSSGMRVLEQVEPDLQRFVNQMERLPGQDKIISVKITPDPKTGFIWIDLGPGFMPRGQTDFDEGLGEKLREVDEELYSYVEGEITFLSIRSRIGGKTLNEWFPPAPMQNGESKEQGDTKTNPVTRPTVPGLVVINPGHGPPSLSYGLSPHLERGSTRCDSSVPVSRQWILFAKDTAFPWL